jgi:hypothetical protein
MADERRQARQPLACHPAAPCPATLLPTFPHLEALASTHKTRTNQNKQKRAAPGTVELADGKERADDSRMAEAKPE